MIRPRFMLDTNAISMAARESPGGRLRTRISACEDGLVCTSILVAAEVRFGLEKNPVAKARQNMELFLASLPVMPLESPADEHYGRIRAHLAAQGRPIGPNDLFIAAHAMALDLTLITANDREFSRVPGLRVENWLAD
jgi:tRNA(fMet)-specific endonuclease VapC